MDFTLQDLTPERVREIERLTNEAIQAGLPVKTKLLPRRQANLKPDPHGKTHASPRFAKGLFGTVNEGHAKVELSSFSGTIKIRKRE